MELEYEACDENGIPFSGNKRPKYQDMSKVQHKDLLDRIFEICGGRKRFGSEREAKNWRLICRKLDKEQMQLGWIESCIQWAADKNKERVVIVFYAVESAILNSSRMKDWEVKNIKLKDVAPSLAKEAEWEGRTEATHE